MKVRFILPLLLVCLFCQAQSAIESEIQNTVTSFYQKLRPETVLIHMSNNTYFTGETIWYSLYLFNAPYSSSDLSSTAYVELLKNGHILCRQKLKLTEGVGAGDFILPKNLSSDYYQIRGYTSWMKNIGEETFFEKIITIINPDNPILPKKESNDQQTQQQFNNVFTITDDSDSLSIDVNGKLNSIVCFVNNGNVVFLKTLRKDSKQYFQIPKSHLIGNFIQNLLFDSNGVLVSEETASFGISQCKIDTNKKSYRMRDRVNIALSTNRNEEPINIYSMAVQKTLTQIDYIMPKTISWNQLHLLKDSKPTWPKEKIIFPRTSNSLDPIAMNVPTFVSTDENPKENIDQVLAGDLNRNQVKQHVMQAYNIPELRNKEKAHKLPFDIIYFPKDFASLPTLEEFFIEITPQIKIKKSKGIKGIRIRNNENSRNIYFFASDPLMVIDGIKVDDPAQVLILDPNDVESIHISYKMNTLNASGIAKYADFGILSIYTKSESIHYKDNQHAIYDGYHVPAIFSYPSFDRNSNDKVPDLRKLIYWKQGIKADSKSEVFFNLSDDLGSFEIEIMGIKQDGTIFHTRKNFEVTLPEND